jgi:secretory phospholipase A2
MDLSRYRKILIYALTFLAYAWSGYGAGLLSNLRDAVLTAESVFHDLFANAITIAWKIKDIHEVFDAAVEENCVFQCPDGLCSLDFVYCS